MIATISVAPVRTAIGLLATSRVGLMKSFFLLQLSGAAGIEVLVREGQRPGTGARRQSRHQHSGWATQTLLPGTRGKIISPVFIRRAHEVCS